MQHIGVKTFLKLQSKYSLQIPVFVNAWKDRALKINEKHHWQEKENKQNNSSAMNFQYVAQWGKKK